MSSLKHCFKKKKKKKKKSLSFSPCANWPSTSMCTVLGCVWVPLCVCICLSVCVLCFTRDRQIQTAAAPHFKRGSFWVQTKLYVWLFLSLLPSYGVSHRSFLLFSKHSSVQLSQDIIIFFFYKQIKAPVINVFLDFHKNWITAHERGHSKSQTQRELSPNSAALQRLKR